MEKMKLDGISVWGEVYYSKYSKSNEYCIVAEIEIPEKIAHLNLLQTNVVTVVLNPVSFEKVIVSRRTQHLKNLLIQHKVRKTWGDDVTVADYLDNFEELLTKLLIKRIGGEDAMFEYYEKIVEELSVKVEVEKKDLFGDIDL